LVEESGQVIAQLRTTQSLLVVLAADALHPALQDLLALRGKQSGEIDRGVQNALQDVLR